MSSEIKKVAWKRMYGNTFSEDSKKTVAAYENYPQYEEDATRLGHADQTPLIAAKHVMKYLTCTGKTLSILDVGTGSGLVGAALRREGFVGDLYGIDGSSNMLKMAKAKEVYKELFCEFIDEFTTFPPKPGYYDGIVSVASFAIGCISLDVIPNMIKLVEQGGIFVISIKTSLKHPEYQEKFEQQLNALKNDGIIEIIEVVPIECYFVVNYEVETDGGNTLSTATLYCFKRC